MIAVLLAVMAPIFMVAAIGYGWIRMGQPFDNHFVTALVAYVGTPCLLLRTFNQGAIGLDDFGSMLVAAVALLVALSLAGLLLLPRLGLPIRDYLPVLMFPNVANMGLPVVLFAYGQDALALAMVVWVVQVIAHNTIGIAIHSGTARAGTLLRLPVVYALALGLTIVATGIHLPLWITRAVDLMGNLTIPLMLMALGASIARLSVHRLGRSVLASGLRIAGGAACAMLVAWAMGLDDLARGVLILQGSMPVAVLSYIYSERFGHSGDEIAGAVVVSTVASLFTVPLLVGLLAV
ncbi:membrane transport protein (plasmid) [Antarctobacter heliothermus]|uniref:Membrane transport protein n=1 Tax=Antarctobacter heliothermus TaxID=74033 RepID=A0A222EBU1_9RHOB|nr:AEC family transporter [Antarctobacter heliothermus]ASP23669.1 membrane transport protein [Antarctobacter heliothermus]